MHRLRELGADSFNSLVKAAGSCSSARNWAGASPSEEDPLTCIRYFVTDLADPLARDPMLLNQVGLPPLELLSIKSVRQNATRRIFILLIKHGLSAY